MQISGLSASNTFSATDVLAIEVNVNGVEKTYKLTGATLAAALASIGSYLKTMDVVNNLTSTNTDKPLSANMGKALHDAVPYRIECGVTTVPAGSDRITVYFSTPFSAKPVVLISPNNSGNGANVIYTVFDRQANSFIALFRGSTYPTEDQVVYWIALGN